MDRDAAISMAQQAIKAKNRRLVEAVLEQQAARGTHAPSRFAVQDLPEIAVTAATGWECYAIVDELSKTRKFRVRALYRTPGTQAAVRLERLKARVDAQTPGLLTLHPGVDMNSQEALTRAFAGCVGVVLYFTANTSNAGKVTNHGKDPAGGRAAVMRQVMAALGALKANPSVTQAITLIFPTDKVTGIVDQVPHPIPWWIDQKLRLSPFLRDQGVNVTCIYRPAYYYAMHRVEYDSDQQQFRGDTKLSRTLIKEGSISGITPPEFLVNWVDVRDIGKWAGTCFEHPDVFLNQDLSLASSAHTGHELVALADQHNRHGTKFRYRRFPMPVMKTLSVFTDEVVYPLRYAQWYTDRGNAYDFASNADLADLERIHPRWSFERELEAWGINDIRPARG